MTMERLKLEIELLQKRYGQVEHSPKLDWVLFKEFPLPEGWNREKTPLLVLIPPGYPSTPPDNFYVAPGLRTAQGVMPGNYSEGQTVLGEQWSQFSFHAKGWNPAGNFGEGDNLLTFMLVVEKRLQEVN